MVVNQADLGRNKSVVLSSGSSRCRVLFAGVGGSSQRRQRGLTFGKRWSRAVVVLLTRENLSFSRRINTCLESNHPCDSRLRLLTFAPKDYFSSQQGVCFISIFYFPPIPPKKRRTVESAVTHAAWSSSKSHLACPIPKICSITHMTFLWIMSYAPAVIPAGTSLQTGHQPLLWKHNRSSFWCYLPSIRNPFQ